MYLYFVFFLTNIKLALLCCVFGHSVPQAQRFGGRGANLAIDEEIVPSCGFTRKLDSALITGKGC